MKKLISKLKQLIWEIQKILPFLKGSKKLYIHIGSPKTGTSAIQKYLNDNKELHEKMGIYYPLIGRSAQLENEKPFFINGTFLTYNNYNHEEAKKIFLNFLKSKFNKMILSEEVLFLDHIYNKKALLFLNRKNILNILSKFDVNIVIFLRLPLQYLCSLWKEYLMYGDKRSLDEFICNYPIENSFWLIKSLQKILGSNKVIIRTYTSESVNDFLDIVNISQRNIRNTKRKINLSYTRKLCEIIHYANLKHNFNGSENRKILDEISTLNDGKLSVYESISNKKKLFYLNKLKSKTKNSLLKKLIINETECLTGIKKQKIETEKLNLNKQTKAKIDKSFK